MYRTYKAKLKSNEVKWLDDKPEDLPSETTYLVYITIVNKEDKKEIQKSNLVEFFKNSPLYDSGIVIERNDDYGREINL